MHTCKQILITHACKHFRLHKSQKPNPFIITLSVQVLHLFAPCILGSHRDEEEGLFDESLDDWMLGFMVDYYAQVVEVPAVFLLNVEDALSSRSRAKVRNI